MNNTTDATGFFYTTIASSGLFLLIITLLFAFYCWHRIFPPRRHPSPPREFEPSDGSLFGIGIDGAIISSFPKLLYSQVFSDGAVVLEKGLNPSACCSICLADYDASDEVRLLPDCNHYFHVKCIDPWLRLRPTCPVCRTSPFLTTLVVDADVP